jgi:cell division septal protein FtsQ
VTGRTRALIGALVITAAFGAWTLAPSVLRHSSFFRIRMVEVSGAHYLDEPEVIHRLQIDADATIFDPIAPILAAARAIPGVVAASVTRRLPGTLCVTILEATPVALTPADDRLALLDYRGRILPFDPRKAPQSLPIADRDSAAAALLGRLMLADPEGYAQIQFTHNDHGDIVLDTGDHRVRFRPNASMDFLRAVAAVRDYLARHAVAWTELDARYRSTVFVKRKPA